MQTSCLIEILFSTFPNEYIVCKIATFILCAFKKSKVLSFFSFPIKNDDIEAVSNDANLLDWTDVNEELEIMQKVQDFLWVLRHVC